MAYLLKDRSPVYKYPFSFWTPSMLEQYAKEHPQDLITCDGDLQAVVICLDKNADL
jgi:hypothetical protein